VEYPPVLPGGAGIEANIKSVLDKPDASKFSTLNIQSRRLGISPIVVCLEGQETAPFFCKGASVMKSSVILFRNSFLKLMNFLAWYIIVLAAVFYLLPMIGLFLEDSYDALAKPVKLLAIIGFFAAAAWWQMKRRTDHSTVSDSARIKNSNQAVPI
jgi:hypothetical protein